jgi:signal transduction histidine kinase
VTISSTIVRTSTFRLAAIYLVIFAASSAAVLAYVFYNTVGILERQAEETIRAEVQALADQYRLRGVSGVADIINRRMEDQTGTLYLLENDQGARLIGNLDDLPGQDPSSGTWLEFPVAFGKGSAKVQHQARGFYVQLDDGYELLVARDIDELRSFRNLIQRSLTAALGLILVLGLGGGYLTSRNFLRRVDAITNASRTIMQGDLSQRMPVSGSGDELDRLAQSLNAMLAQIERLMLGMKEMSSNVAHDLRTPLTRLRARVESALRTENAAEHKQALEKTIEESDRLLSTFTALLSIARAESGNAREGLVPADAADIVTEVAELYEPIVEDADGSLQTQVRGPLPVRADRQLLAQAISNLLDNAMKYGAEEGSQKTRLSIDARRDGDWVRITVSDSGAGIAAQDRDRVLDRFVRLDESRSKPGNGLGLSLVASVMKLHGGTLTLGDAGPGLSATLALPVHETVA